MATSFFRRSKSPPPPSPPPSASTSAPSTTRTIVSTKRQEPTETSYSRRIMEPNLPPPLSGDGHNNNPVVSHQQTTTSKKNVNFAAAGKMKMALRTVLTNMDKLEVDDDMLLLFQRFQPRRPGLAKMKQMLLESMTTATSTNNDCNDDLDVLLDEDGKNQDHDDDDGYGDVANNNNLDWVLSPQQIFDLTVSTLRAQIETLEERNNFIARIQALERQLDHQRVEERSLQDSQHELQCKSTQVTKLMEQVESLKHDLQESHATIERLQNERDSHQRAVTELSRVLRSCDPNADDDDMRCAIHAVTPRQADGAISKESALYLTIYRLKKQMEALEDERDEFVAEIHNLGAALNEFKEEKEARELKISVLENQLEVMDKQFKVMDAAMKDGPLTSCHSM